MLSETSNRYLSMQSTLNENHGNTKNTNFQFHLRKFSQQTGMDKLCTGCRYGAQSFCDASDFFRVRAFYLVKKEETIRSTSF